MKKKNSTSLLWKYPSLGRLAQVISEKKEINTSLSSRRLITTFLISGLMAFISWVWTPSAIALTQIKLFDLSYHECPAELAKGAVTSGGSATAANCFIVAGKAENGTYKTVYDADIYGRIYDANNDPILQNRTRLGSIAEVPPGVSDFELRISVPANQPLPLKLKQFKASGFSAQVRR